MLPALQVHCFPVPGDVVCSARAVLLRAGVMHWQPWFWRRTCGCSRSACSSRAQELES